MSEVRCSLCGEPKDEVSTGSSRRAAFICTQCVALFISHTSVPGRALWRGFLTAQEFTNFLSMHYRVPTIDLDAYEVEDEVLKLIASDACMKHLVLPVSRAGRSLIVAMADPTNSAAITELSGTTGYAIEPVIATEEAIKHAIDKYYGRSG